MKKYAVLKKIGMFGATVEREFDNIDDAHMFKNLLVSAKKKTATKIGRAHV